MVEKKIEVRGKSQWRKMKTSCAIIYIYTNSSKLQRVCGGTFVVTQ